MAQHESSLSERVASVEVRVAALERAQAGNVHHDSTSARSGVRPVLDPDTFWALAGLRDRTESGGGVLFTGTVELPEDELTEWQQQVPTSELLESDWRDRAEMLAALAHPIRLLLLREILRGKRTAAELGSVDELGTSGQLYHHLRQLVAAGWLHTTGRGRYEVPAVRVVPLMVIVATVRS